MKAIDIALKIKSKRLAEPVLRTLNKIKKGDTLVVYSGRERRVYRKLDHNKFSERIEGIEPSSFEGRQGNAPIIYDDVCKAVENEEKVFVLGEGLANLSNSVNSRLVMK